MLSAAAVAEAWQMRQAKAAWPAIAARFGLNVEKLRRTIDPDYRASRNAYRKQRARAVVKARMPAPVAAVDQTPLTSRGITLTPPPGMTVTAWAMGDPPPGRSALDEKRALGLRP